MKYFCRYYEKTAFFVDGQKRVIAIGQSQILRGPNNGIWNIANTALNVAFKNNGHFHYYCIDFTKCLLQHTSFYETDPSVKILGSSGIPDDYFSQH